MRCHNVKKASKGYAEMFLKKRNQKGFSLLEMVVTVAIGSVMTLGFGSLLSWTANLQTQAVSKLNIENFKQQMMVNLADDTAWLNTVAGNGTNSMACLVNVTDCTTNGLPFGPPIEKRSFMLFDKDNQVLFDSTVPSNGLTAKGTPCNAVSAPPGYDGVNGNDQCPYRYELHWSAVCSGTDPARPCTNPQVKISAFLLHSPASGTQKTIMGERYSIRDFYPGPSPCFARTAIVPQSGTFTVPAKYNYLVAEVWGGGGGGTAADAYCNISQGGDGGLTNFWTVSAAGGRGGIRDSIPGGIFNWFWAVCWGGGLIQWPNCSGTAPTVLGGDGYPPTPYSGPTIPAAVKMCTDTAGLSPTGGSGKGGQACALDGSLSGGGGAGSCYSQAGPFVFAGNCWLVVFWFYTTGGAGAVDNLFVPWLAGKYNRAVYVPGTLPPGTVVPVTVGAGGARGAVGAVVGGGGANGLVKITWW
jgi:prepilin-type N-terminal cleavage/methylation domain-containing protein